jgi:hypothetical protein
MAFDSRSCGGCSEMEAAKGSPPSLKGRRVVERMCWSENGKAPHANQEPSRMGNGGQVRNAGGPEVKYCFEDEDVTHVAENMAELQVRRR